MDTITKAFLSGKGENIKEAKKDISKILHEYYKEKWKEKKGIKATQKLRILRNKFIKLSESEKENDRIAGLKGLGTIVFSNIFNEKIDKMIELFFKTIVDDNGYVRLASANTFGHIRSGLIEKTEITEQTYAEVYLGMIELLDSEDNPKKRKSIEIALGLLYSPMLESILIQMNYVKSKNQPKYISTT